MNKRVTAMVLTLTAGLAMAQSDCCRSAQKDGEGEPMLGASVELPAGAYGLELADRFTPLALATLGAQPESRVESHMVMIQKDDDHEYKVEVVNGDVKAWVDGERVPKDRVRVTDNQISVVDEDGDTIVEFAYSRDRAIGSGSAGQRRIVTRALGDEHDGPIVWESDDGVWTTQPPGDAWASVAPDGNFNRMFITQPEGGHPPVMIGINMNSLGEDEADDELLDILRRHDLGAEDAIVVLSVIDGLPADEAGVRDGDVIVRVDGEWGVAAEELREVLGDKEPGDEIELAVVRDGRLREITVELAAWDAEKLGASITYGLELGEEGEIPLNSFLWRMDDGREDVLKLLHERLGELGGEGEDLEIRLRAFADELRADANNRQLQFDVMPRIQRFTPGAGGEDRLLVQPPPRAQAMDGFQDRLARIEDRLEQLERRLDRILEALERDRD